MTDEFGYTITDEYLAELAMKQELQPVEIYDDLYADDYADAMMRDLDL